MLWCLSWGVWGGRRKQTHRIILICLFTFDSVKMQGETQALMGISPMTDEARVSPCSIAWSYHAHPQICRVFFWSHPSQNPGSREQPPFSVCVCMCMCLVLITNVFSLQGCKEKFQIMTLGYLQTRRQMISLSYCLHLENLIIFVGDWTHRLFKPLGLAINTVKCKMYNIPGFLLLCSRFLVMTMILLLFLSLP